MNSMDQSSCRRAIKYLESFSMDQSSYQETIENAIKVDEELDR